jgi:lincosamide nucleotidyltransferase A/C/D/E
MTAADVVAVLDRLADAGVEAWVEGGWGIDALAGEETRPHEDLDLVLPVEHWQAAVAALRRLDLEVDDRRSQPPSSLFLGNASLRVDLHPVVLDARGNGWQPGGRRAWDLYPAEGFGGRGTIGGRAVRCLSPEVQLRHHLGYEWDDGDVHDLRLLAQRFGVPLPPDLEPGQLDEPPMVEKRAR